MRSCERSCKSLTVTSELCPYMVEPSAPIFVLVDQRQTDASASAYSGATRRVTKRTTADRGGSARRARTDLVLQLRTNDTSLRGRGKRGETERALRCVHQPAPVPQRTSHTRHETNFF